MNPKPDFFDRIIFPVLCILSAVYFLIAQNWAAAAWSAFGCVAQILLNGYRRDAYRYRYLRQSSKTMVYENGVEKQTEGQPKEFDRAIDLAMERKPG